MDFFFIEYRDPIFGLIVLFAAVLLVAISSYALGIWGAKDENRSIEKFVKKFENSSGLSQKHKNMLLDLDIDINSLSVLALTFAKSGDFDKAISVYLVALEKSKDKKEREFLLTSLGKIYIKAGFLKRASDMFLEAIKLRARNDEALRYLSVCYEKLRMYKNCLEALDALDEQGVIDKAEIAYTKALILRDEPMKFDAKIKGFLELSDDFEPLKRMALEQFIKNGEPLSSLSVFPKLDICKDLMFRLKEPVNLQDSEFRQFFKSLNLIKDEIEIEDFNLSLFKAAKDNGINATLSFSYFCSQCKTSYPIFFYRCPNCVRLGSCKILTQISKDEIENSMPF
ncbi:tetratricopeptide repeat protein [Campylobacter hyointestinalis]|uniref:tetratricopeptide repeat protein n=1 Tax=Campylobacter hyointestinalis TaxID=198 RepID=UPI000DCB45C4|nr:hypothetical protein [Campylobacter hyointestinalis]RAZ45621.1 hypothetical protein CHL14416_08010 [Campylobacter hyointestinalis subsp. lawsonii]